MKLLILKCFYITAGIFLSLITFKTLMIHTDNLQMMDKAVKYITTGEFIHFGNEATKVGTIPGSFLTFVSAVPMKFWPSPYAAMAVILIFHLASLWFLFKTLKLIETSSLSILLLIVMYWLNPWRVEQSELYNPGYLFLFSTLHLYSSQKMYEKKFWWTFIHVLTIGFCMQIHFSFLIIAMVSLLLFLKGQIIINWKGFSAALALVIISLIPYLIQKSQPDYSNLNTVNLMHKDAFLGKNALLVYPVLKSILYYFRMGSMYFGRHIFSEINFEWISSEFWKSIVGLLFKIIEYSLAAASLWISFKFIGHFLKARFIHWRDEIRLFETRELNIEKRFYDYFFILFISTVITAGLSPVEFNHWHLILCFPTIILFLILKIQNYFSLQRNLILSFVFIVWSLFAALGSRSHSYKNDYQRDFFEHYKKELHIHI